MSTNIVTSPNGIRAGITGIHGDISFSQKDVYLWVAVTPVHYEFKDLKSREKFAVDTTHALANILNSEEEDLECHLICTSKDFDYALWRHNYLRVAAPAKPPAVLNDFSLQMANLLHDYQFRTKKVYLGVNLGKRTSFNPTKEITKIAVIDKFLSTIGGEVDEYISTEELAYWESKAKLVRYSLLNGSMPAEEVRAEEVAYIVRKYFFPGIPAPTVEDLNVTGATSWGAGELQTLTDADIENHPKWLKVSQEVEGETLTGYRATLCIAKFPETLLYPQKEPWIHIASTLPFPVDIHSRFNVVPSKKVRKQVTNKIKDIKDQAVNMQSSGGAISMEVEENFQLGQYLEFALGRDETPWLYGRHRIVVEATTEDELKERVQAVMDLYKDQGFLVVWPTGDQMDLLLECLPNDKVRISSYYQRHELAVIGAGVPAGSGGAGDLIVRTPEGQEKGWLGPYVGYTNSRVAEPVFLSLHSAIAQNKAPGLVITGSPGSGKSFTAFTLTYNMVTSGVQTVYIDPKNDAIPLSTLPGCENTTIVDMNDSPNGILDPFQIGENEGEKIDLVNETISLFVGGTKNLSSAAQSELSRTIKVVLRDRYPTMNKLTEILLSSKQDDAQALGEHLSIIRKLPFSRLCFSDATKEKPADYLKLNPRLTILTLLGLDLPPSLTPKEDYSTRNRLAVSILFLLTSYVKRVVIGAGRADSRPRAIVVDEAWAITATAQGAKMVLEIARLGRSMNTGLVLVSQNAGDFIGEGITNSVSTRMCFGTQDEQETKNVLSFIGLPETPENIEVVQNLNQGECIIRDANARISRMKVDGWNPQMSYAFETNPLAKRENEERKSLENQHI